MAEKNPKVLRNLNHNIDNPLENPKGCFDCFYIYNSLFSISSIIGMLKVFYKGWMCLASAVTELCRVK